MLSLHTKDVIAAILASAAFALGASLAVEVAGRFATAGIAGALVLVFLLAAALLYRRIEHKTEELRFVAEASAALYQAIQPVTPLPPMSGFAIAADSALLLHTLLTRERPKTVVETGSGVSTLIIGYALKSQGDGRLISLEADPRYAQQTRDWVSLHGLDEFVTVIDAPLTDLTIEGERYRWHDIRALDGVTSIDLVLDDGPPLYLGKGLRRAGLPALRSKLRSGGIYLLNFIAAEERRAVAEWLQRYPHFEAETLRTRKENVVLRRPQQPS